MKTRLNPIFLILALVPMALVSCASLGQAGANSMAAIKKTSSGAVSKISKISEDSLASIRPSRVKVVEVRENDLKKLPTGAERALAFEKSRKRSFWNFGGPVDFQEPLLPQAGAEMDGSLLPPKNSVE